VIAHLLRRNVPALHRVTLLAIWPHLSAVNVRVAVGAVLSHICEHRFRMALRAFHLFVHAAQWIFRFVVVEFRDGANRPPTCGGVAVLAGYAQRAVRVALRFLLSRIPGRRAGPRRPRRKRTGWNGEHQHSPERELEHRERKVLPSVDKDTYCWALVKISTIFRESKGSHYCPYVQLRSSC